MTLPIDLVLVRHGQSEGNKAKRLSEAGDDSAYTDDFLIRHSAGFRLTDKGREQALQTGKFLRKDWFGNYTGFNRYITSEYLRAMETAGHLQLPGAEWYCEPYLTERDWGELDIYPENERQERFGAELQRREIEPFFWRPPNGESFLGLCRRVDRVLDTLHRECSDKHVLIVCHGEVMRAFQVRIERISQVRFKELMLSRKSEDRIYNCQVVHYTRANPADGALSPYAGWVKWTRPTDTPVTTSGWQKIIRPPHYSNEKLLEVVSRTPAMIR
ncbi:MAG: histidine phosphatase family protein [Patescibacteria group bacterium]|nr:histidine phosphatase family protein [Patescibacteria group bacterium]